MVDIQLQLPKELVKAVEAPNTQLEQTLWQKIVLELYREETISFGKACELLGLTKWEFTDLLREKDVPLSYSADDLEEDLQALKDFKLVAIQTDQSGTPYFRR
jgi:predicted HTH domain antitoxin